MFRRVLVFSAIALLGWASVDTSAQGRARGRVGRENMRFAEMDANRDGVITRNEWRGSAQAFRSYDWNGDGVLAGEEVRGGGDFDDWTTRGFNNLDTNRDGRLTANEWYFDRAEFTRADRNRDGVISRSEFLNNSNVDYDREDSYRSDDFAALDWNRDGRISRGEWTGGMAEFDSRDTNRDNFLSPRELRSVDTFTQLDRNRDRVLMRDEWRADLGNFNEYDRNNDRRITPDEFRGQATGPRRTRAFSAGYERGQAEGRQAGREDRATRHGWDLEGQQELERADSGYNSTIGSRTEYQAGYREGFRQAYGDGYRS